MQTNQDKEGTTLPPEVASGTIPLPGQRATDNKATDNEGQPVMTDSAPVEDEKKDSTTHKDPPDDLKPYPDDF